VVKKIKVKKLISKFIKNWEFLRCKMQVGDTGELKILKAGLEYFNKSNIA
jgi:hypothetical protein